MKTSEKEIHPVVRGIGMQKRELTSSVKATSGTSRKSKRSTGRRCAAYRITHAPAAMKANM